MFWVFFFPPSTSQAAAIVLSEEGKGGQRHSAVQSQQGRCASTLNNIFPALSNIHLPLKRPDSRCSLFLWNMSLPLSPVHARKQPLWYRCQIPQRWHSNMCQCVSWMFTSSLLQLLFVQGGAGGDSSCYLTSLTLHEQPPQTRGTGLGSKGHARFKVLRFVGRQHFKT